MALYALASAKGSPGVTTSRRMALAARLADRPGASPTSTRPAVTSPGATAPPPASPLDTDRGLLSLGAAVRRGAAGGRPRRPPPGDRRRRPGARRRRLAGAGRGPRRRPGASSPTVFARRRPDVLADCGRVVPGSASLPVLQPPTPCCSSSRPDDRGHRAPAGAAQVAAPTARASAASDGVPVGVAVVTSYRDTRSGPDLQQLLDSEGLRAAGARRPRRRQPKAADALRGAGYARYRRARCSSAPAVRGRRASRRARRPPSRHRRDRGLADGPAARTHAARRGRRDPRATAPRGRRQRPAADDRPRTSGSSPAPSSAGCSRATPATRSPPAARRRARRGGASSPRASTPRCSASAGCSRCSTTRGREHRHQRLRQGLRRLRRRPRGARRAGRRERRRAGRADPDARRLLRPDQPAVRHRQPAARPAAARRLPAVRGHGRVPAAVAVDPAGPAVRGSPSTCWWTTARCRPDAGGVPVRRGPGPQEHHDRRAPRTPGRPRCCGRWPTRSSRTSG